jgi:phosphotransferase system HPr (HPr) family protein
MHENTCVRTARVGNPKGLHMRPALLIVQLASKFQSQIEITKDSLKVNATSVLDVMTLAATNGSQLVISARGCDAQEAVDALVQFLETDASDDSDPHAYEAH